ncbi:hypothetical protein ONE63_007274 [Megalurothrips usitatus]|uniref:Uncharacterized protein n=1 Tax=Megalurothrips usitatus TaxID=439358 RepID=A0AAV7XRI4_9NEOP|nr:hypothetical protein ONE63_007274 [Megalurothrips usitatus]
MQVWVGEDATKAVDRVEFDPSSNLLVGLVLPLTEHGVPRLRVFEATSTSAIQEIMRTEEVAGSLYCIMAQPLSANASAFCLMLAGTNGKFDHHDVLRRWSWIVREARKYGIIILGFSSDGDEKLLKAMRLLTFPNSVTNPPQWSDWFHADLKTHTFTMQDFVHILAKFKSRLTKVSVQLPMGNFDVSIGHLRILIKEVSKDIHGLTEGLLDLKDKMNYRSTEKICSHAVTDLLSKHVPNRNATVCYLRLMRDSTEAFMDRSLPPLDRIEKIWRCLFFLRMWRQWLIREKYSVKDCFVTLNTYHCLEVNGHAIIGIVRHMRDAGLPTESFVPWKMSSQMNENHFRKARSTTSTLYTAVNFSVLDFLHRTKRIDLLNDVPAKLNENYSFPASKRVVKIGREVHGEVAQFGSFPNDAEIISSVDKARDGALQMSEELSMDMPSYSVNAFIDFSDPSFEGFLWTEDDAASRIEEAHEHDAPEPETQNQVSVVERDVEEDVFIASTGAVGLKTFEGVELLPESPFVAVRDANQKTVVVRKSSLVWSLSTGKPLMDKSAQRSERVRAPVPWAGSACAGAAS